MEINNKYYEQYELDYFNAKKKYKKMKINSIVRAEIEKLHPDFHKDTIYFTKIILIKGRLRILIFVFNNYSDLLNNKKNFIIDKKYGLKFNLSNEKKIIYVTTLFIIFSVSFMLFLVCSLDNNYAEIEKELDVKNKNVESITKTSEIMKLIFKEVEKQNKYKINNFEYKCVNNYEVIDICFENFNFKNFIDSISEELLKVDLDYSIEEIAYVNNIPVFEIEFKRKINKQNIKLENKFIDEELKELIVINNGYLKSEDINYLSFVIPKECVYKLFSSEKWINYKILNIYLNLSNEMCDVQINLGNKSCLYGLTNEDLKIISRNMKSIKNNKIVESKKEDISLGNLIGKISKDGKIIKCIKDDKGKIIIKRSEYE